MPELHSGVTGSVSAMSQFACPKDAALALEGALSQLRRREMWGDHHGPFQDSDEPLVEEARAAIRYLARDV